MGSTNVNKWSASKVIMVVGILAVIACTIMIALQLKAADDGKGDIAQPIQSSTSISDGTAADNMGASAAASTANEVAESGIAAATAGISGISALNNADTIDIRPRPQMNCYIVKPGMIRRSTLWGRG